MEAGQDRDADVPLEAAESTESTAFLRPELRQGRVPSAHASHRLASQPCKVQLGGNCLELQKLPPPHGSGHHGCLGFPDAGGGSRGGISSLPEQASWPGSGSNRAIPVEPLVWAGLVQQHGMRHRQLRGQLPVQLGCSHPRHAPALSSRARQRWLRVL